MLRRLLIHAKLLGLAAFLGGLAALVALGLFGPEPIDREGWRLLRGSMRAIFFACVFAGIVLAVLAGIALFLLRPRHFLGRPWFRIKLAALAVLLPALHLTARGRVLALDAALEAGRLDLLPGLREGVTRTLALALVLMLGVALFARLKPGERRRP